MKSEENGCSNNLSEFYVILLIILFLIATGLLMVCLQKIYISQVIFTKRKRRLLEFWRSLIIILCFLQSNIYLIFSLINIYHNYFIEIDCIISGSTRTYLTGCVWICTSFLIYQFKNYVQIFQNPKKVEANEFRENN